VRNVPLTLIALAASAASTSPSLCCVGPRRLPRWPRSRAAPPPPALPPMLTRAGYTSGAFDCIAASSAVTAGSTSYSTSTSRAASSAMSGVVAATAAMHCPA
jgi:hypothetical protein